MRDARKLFESAGWSEGRAWVGIDAVEVGLAGELELFDERQARRGCSGCNRGGHFCYGCEDRSGGDMDAEAAGLEMRRTLRIRVPDGRF